jgi:hypothetical protein
MFAKQHTTPNCNRARCEPCCRSELLPVHRPHRRLLDHARTPPQSNCPNRTHHPRNHAAYVLTNLCRALMKQHTDIHAATTLSMRFRLDMTGHIAAPHHNTPPKCMLSRAHYRHIRVAGLTSTQPATHPDTNAPNNGSQYHALHTTTT